MEKSLEYNLKVDVSDSFPQMPTLHDNKVEKIAIDKKTLSITVIADGYDDDGFYFIDFHAKKVRVEFIFDDEVECNIIVSKYFPKKQIKENNKFGFGKKSNCYDIHEFIEFYKCYNLETLYNMVSYQQVNLVLAGNNKKRISDIVMEIFCNKVRYTFYDEIN